MRVTVSFGGDYLRVLRSGWCSGHQGCKNTLPEVRYSRFVLQVDLPLGGMTVVVDASGQQRSYSGDAWTSHSCKQMATYSATCSAQQHSAGAAKSPSLDEAVSDTFLLATAGDAYPDKRQPQLFGGKQPHRCPVIRLVFSTLKDFCSRRV